MKVVGLGGYAGAGKDAVADVLESMGWERTYVSRPLEHALLTLDPYIVVSMGTMRYSEIHAEVGYDASKKIPEVRRLLQVLGTEVGREMFGPDVWINACLNEVLGRYPAPVGIVVTGIRYHNEMEAIRTIGGRLYWVSRPGYGPVNTHSSDNTLSADDFDGDIANDGTLGDLDREVRLRFSQGEARTQGSGRDHGTQGHQKTTT